MPLDQNKKIINARFEEKIFSLNYLSQKKVDALEKEYLRTYI